MKQFTLLLLLFLTIATNAQVKISQMPPYTGNADSVQIPVVLSGSNYKYPGYKLVQNQYSAKQTASAWIDSLKVTKIESTDATNGVILRSSDGSRWRITIDNDGALRSTKL
jgi:hypothetical protein